MPEMVFRCDDAPAFPAAQAINAYFLADETECVDRLMEVATLSEARARRVQETAERLVKAVRQNRVKKGGLDAFLKQYDLSSQEGVVLMCLAEALLRIPDAETADKLIADKLAAGDWKGHLGSSDSLFVNASTWGLMLTGRIIRPDEEVLENPSSFVGRMAARIGEPVVRTAMRQAMRIMGHQFVMGRTIQDALDRSLNETNRIFRHSFDMLGEAALTAKDAERYLHAYADAIRAIGKTVEAGAEMAGTTSISVKLSALHPRYEFSQRTRVLAELTPRLLALAEQARNAKIALTVDAEEADRLELSLQVFAAVYESPVLGDWDGLGLAVQAYQKRCLALVGWLIDLAAQVGRRMPIRLVKGAYWDTEIKRAQERGLDGFPVFTRKSNTDVSYLACARKLLQAGHTVYPQFATHNAHTVASIVQMADGNRDFEFQRLHGMGEELYEEIVSEDKLNIPCRVYAPVGEHEDLLPYLVRRLLENGANTSFVNRIVDENARIEEIIADPLDAVRKLEAIPHPRILKPADLFLPFRANSRGINLADGAKLASLAASMQQAAAGPWHARPVVGGKVLSGVETVSLNPANRNESPGIVVEANEATVDAAVALAVEAHPAWDRTPADVRAGILDRAAELMEQRAHELMAMCVLEAGKSIPDSVAELREAVDFLRYYAATARQQFGEPTRLPGPTGESNELRLAGRGIFVCISPWNFPLAIFTGQVSAALAAGNAVLAKPAEQTPLVAAAVVDILHRAGVPGEVLHFLPGQGAVIGAAAVSDPRIAGVAFTGSTETAALINRNLAKRDGPIATFIAETGGQNAMLVDSSALPEQVVLDVVQSAFHSAGQRCSALRVLFLQEEVAPKILELLTGYMRELVIGDPAILSTDVGPVIDEEALATLSEHAEMIARSGRVVHRCALPGGLAQGTFMPPLAVEIEGLEQLDREVFGPILHIVRYGSQDLDAVIESVNDTGYGLTLGIHSRIDSTARYIEEGISAGNVYVNRNMIGAVVGVQPFGGCGLSGTGPKAGGPHYLARFAHERTVTVNTAAVGGNASLLALGRD